MDGLIAVRRAFEARRLRYADRWSIEVANATGKQVLGVGQARNRLPRAVERTVPFELLIRLWSPTGTPPAGTTVRDLVARRSAEPRGYTGKTEPSFEELLAKLRRALIAARFTATTPNPLDPNIIRDYELACAAAEAAA